MINYTPTPNYYEDFIEHHGVKGMRWGHRKKTYTNGMSYRQMKKAVKKDRKLFKQKAETDKKLNDLIKKQNDDYYKKADKYEKQAIALGKKFKFDLDDGGGGKTKADQKAGMKYMDLWEKADKLRSTADSNGSQKRREWTSNKMINKYGKENLSAFDQEYNKRSLRKVEGVVAGVGAIGLGALGYAFYKSFKR